MTTLFPTRIDAARMRIGRKDDVIRALLARLSDEARAEVIGECGGDIGRVRFARVVRAVDEALR